MIEKVMVFSFGKKKGQMVSSAPGFTGKSKEHGTPEEQRYFGREHTGVWRSANGVRLPRTVDPRPVCVGDLGFGFPDGFRAE